MKQSLSRIFALAAFAAVSAHTAWAIPTLQLDIVGGTYVGGSEESTVSNGPVFDLQALVTSDYLAANPNRTFYISAAIVPKTSVPLTANFGSFTINGVTYDASGMAYGQPPVELIEHSQELAPHDIYDTHYAEVAFTFSATDLIAAYNVQDGSSSPGTVNFHTFDVDVTGLAAGYQVHFDLYNTVNVTGKGKKATTREEIDQFAPFSKDAVSGPSTRVPDAGSTVVLLGFALAGLGTVRRLVRN